MGQVTYRWLEGGFFLVQDFDLERYGQQVKGLEPIGREKEFGAEQPSSDIVQDLRQPGQHLHLRL